MDLLLILLYAGICTAIFKVFKIPMNKYTVPTAVLGGVIFLGTLVFWMNFKHPYAKYVKEVYVSIPVLPAVSGVVTDVPIEPNVEVEAGTVLFQIDKRPYQFEIDRLEAKLVDAKQHVKETLEMVKMAEAMVEEGRAERDRVKMTLEKVESAGTGVVAQREIDSRRQQLLASVSRLLASRAELRRLELSASAKIGGIDTSVREIESKLDLARYNLDQTTVRAPVKGLVTQLALRKGTVVKALPLRPSLVFVPTERRRLVASFWQNSLRNLKQDATAEVILDSVPGHIFEGRVSKVSPVIPEANYQFGGSLLAGEFIKHHDRTLLMIELEENLNDYNLPTGVQGQAAVYSAHDMLHSSPMRKILLRMMGWTNYLYPVKK